MEQLPCSTAPQLSQALPGWQVVELAIFTNMNHLDRLRADAEGVCRVPNVSPVVEESGVLMQCQVQHAHQPRIEGFQTTSGATAREICQMLLRSPDVAAALCLSETECYVCANLSVRPGYDGVLCSATNNPETPQQPRSHQESAIPEQAISTFRDAATLLVKTNVGA